jgi:hypothetical protein
MPIVQVPAECPVGYLRDSVEIVSSLAFNGTLQQNILRAVPEEFTPLGAFYCDALGDELFIGIKKRNRFKVERPVHEIAIAETLLRGDAALGTNLPIFTVGITDGDQFIGTLTEDFSQNGRYDLWGERVVRVPIFCRNPAEIHSELHRQVYRALNGNICPEPFGHMSALVLDRSVIIDFDEIAYFDREPVEQVMEQVNPYRHFAYIALSQLI